MSAIEPEVAAENEGLAVSEPEQENPEPQDSDSVEPEQSDGLVDEVADEDDSVVPNPANENDDSVVPVSLPMSVHTAKLEVQDTETKLVELKTALDSAADDWYASVVGVPGAESAYKELKQLAAV